jgi:hypothetical protein
VRKNQLAILPDGQAEAGSGDFYGDDLREMMDEQTPTLPPIIG